MAGAQHYPPAALYVVATPIGNLADLTLRAIHVLALVDALACEDTRVSGALLHALGLAKPLLALHRHNEHAATARVLRRLARGERVACVSDAGTPGVSDPGAVLVAAVAAAGHPVVPIPGPSSVMAALSVAGDSAADGCAFAGFLPARGVARERALASVLARPGTQILLESPHRIAALAQALARAAPARRMTVCRELTKQFETVATLVAADGPDWLAADANRTRGEFVVVLHALAAPAAARDALPPEAERLLALLLRQLPLKQAVAIAAEASGLARGVLYARALALRGAGERADS